MSYCKPHNTYSDLNICLYCELDRVTALYDECDKANLDLTFDLSRVKADLKFAMSERDDWREKAELRLKEGIPDKFWDQQEQLDAALAKLKIAEEALEAANRYYKDECYEGGMNEINEALAEIRNRTYDKASS